MSEIDYIIMELSINQSVPIVGALIVALLFVIFLAPSVKRIIDNE